MSSTRTNCHINAPRGSVYRALLDPRAVAKWKVPDGMTCRVHAFDAREGGSFRISLTYDARDERGKTIAHTDTYHGRFVKLVPNEQVIEVDEFETDDPTLRGEMTLTITLTDARVAARISSLYMTGCRAAYRPLTTRWAGEWRSQNSRCSSKRR